MSQDFQQHWLSAYLDNELSSDERALVERHLEEDPQARQLLDDLKRVRGLVAALPAWSGSNFQFDMSRLSAEEFTDDEDTDELQSNRIVATAATKPILESSIEPKQPSTGMSTAAWRGVLSLAAGLLLLILCVPLFWQRDAGTFAVGSRPQESAFGEPADSTMGGGQMDRMSDSAKIETASEQDSNAFGLPAQPPKPAAPAPADPAPFAPVAPAPMLVPSQPSGPGGGGRGAQPGPPPSAVAESKPPSDLGRRAMGGLGGASANAPAANAPLAEVAGDSPSLQPADPGRRDLTRGLGENRAAKPPRSAAGAQGQPEVAGFDSNQQLSQLFMCAKSEAWSEAEVAQTLNQLLPYVAEKDADHDKAKSKSNVDTQTTGAKETVELEDKVLAKLPEPLNNQEVVSKELPATADLNQWFAQIQTAQSLTQVPLVEEQLFGAQLTASDAQKANKAESVLSETQQHMLPPASSPAAGTARSSSANKLDFAGKSLQADKSQADTAQAPSDENHERILLFVTAAEAQKILSTLSPAKPDELPEQSPAKKKVIVILSRRR